MKKNNKIVIFEFQDLRYASRARKEAFSLSKNGFDVTLIGFNREKTHKESFITNNVKFIEFPFLNIFKDKFIGKVLNVFYLNILLTIFLIRNDYNIYHLHDLKLFLPALMTFIIKRRPLIYDAHELHIKKRAKKSFKNTLLNKYDELKERVLLRISYITIQASDLRAEYFKTYYKTSKPLVLENHDNITSIDSDVVDVRKILNLSKNDIILIYTGNITIGRNQRIDNVIESLVFLPDNVYFCVMGRGSLGTIEILMRIAKERGVSNRFKIITPVLSERVVSTISGADIGIIPILANCLNSEYSALNKLSQSLMAGLIIAASDYANMKEIILNNNLGAVGVVFDVNSPKSISEAIIKILKMDMSSLKHRARMLAIAKLNWEREEHKLIEVYKKLLL